MADTWQSPTPRDEIYARVLGRARRIRLVRIWIVAAVVAGLVAAGVGGYAAGVSGTVFEGAPVALPGASAPYSACPGTASIGELHRGDRVLLTGVDAKGDWYEIRSPIDLVDRVWIKASSVTPDEAPKLPTVTCGLQNQKLAYANGKVVTPTTTTAPASSTSTSSTTTTTVAPGGSSPTQTAPTSVPGGSQPTVPPTTKPTVTAPPPPAPVLGSPTANPTAIWENNPGVCGDPATTATVAADASHSTAAVLHWQVQGVAPGSAGSTGSKAMARNGSHFSAVLGPFSENTIPFGSSKPITVWVTASGPGGQASSAHLTVTLHDCTFG